MAHPTFVGKVIIPVERGAIDMYRTFDRLRDLAIAVREIWLAKGDRELQLTVEMIEQDRISITLTVGEGYKLQATWSSNGVVTQDGMLLNLGPTGNANGLVAIVLDRLKS